MLVKAFTSFLVVRFISVKLCTNIIFCRFRRRLIAYQIKPRPIKPKPIAKTRNKPPLTILLNPKWNAIEKAYPSNIKTQLSQKERDRREAKAGPIRPLPVAWREL